MPKHCTNAVSSMKTDMVIWLLERSDRLQWDSFYFAYLLDGTPDAALAYLDKFAIERDGFDIEYFDLRLIYGSPEASVHGTALAIAVKNVKRFNVLNHRVMRYIINAKWGLVANAFKAEMSIYFGLLLSYQVTILYSGLNWSKLESLTDYVGMLWRINGWFCCLYLIRVEFREFQNFDYFLSYWNWLNMISYGATLVSIPFEFIGGPTRNGLIALISITLWINVLQYVSIHKATGVLIASMGRMVRVVGQFFLLYSMFFFGFSDALYLILCGADGYKTIGDTFITVLLMLFGNLTYDPFGNATGWRWIFSNILLLIYLVCVVVMLLNVLIAMMSASFTSITEAAEEQYWLRIAEVIVRIERSIPVSTRQRYYNTLVPAGADDSIAAKERASMGSKIQPLGETTPNSNRKRGARKTGGQKTLEDGIRSDWSRVKMKSDSTQMETRLDTLQASNQEMKVRMQDLTAVIMDLLQRQLSSISSALVAVDTTTELSTANVTPVRQLTAGPVIDHEDNRASMIDQNQFDFEELEESAVDTRAANQVTHS